MASASLLSDTHVSGATPSRLSAASPLVASSDRTGLAVHSSKLHCARKTSPGLSAPNEFFPKVFAPLGPSNALEEVLRWGKTNNFCRLPGVSVLVCKGAGSRHWHASEKPIPKLQRTTSLAPVPKKGRLERAKASKVETPVEDQEGGEQMQEMANADNFSDKKLCTECAVRKPFRNFGKLVSSADGLHIVCRACLAKRRAQARGGELHHLAMPVAEAWEQARECHWCKHVQELRDFARCTASKDGLLTYCRSCASARNDTWKSSEQPTTVPFPEVAACTRCKQEKRVDEFYFATGNKYRLLSWCKTCTKEARSEREAKMVAAGAYIGRPNKFCRMCGVNKPRESFGIDRVKRDGLANNCKDCNVQVSRQQRARKRLAKGT